MFDRNDVAAAARRVTQDLPGLDWITDSRVERLSQDFYWFSPVLQRQLGDVRADAVVRPRSEDEVVAVLAHCARLRLPVTVRGSGTGNYGQCMPLHGGIVLDLSSLRELIWSRDGVARAQAGIRLGELDRQTQAQGWELRCVPSTFRSATLGGLFGGGFGGVGSINYGPLACPGNVLGVKVITVEPEPRVLELRAPEALLLHHAYGTNGVVVELDVALAPAHPWLEAIATFDDFDAAIAFADTLAQAPGIVKKSVTLLAQPIPDLLIRATPWLTEHLGPCTHAVLMLVAEWAEPALQQLLQTAQGRLTMNRPAAAVRQSNRTLVESTWNHTTLHALKVDRTLTYIQSSFQPGRQVEQARTLRAHFGDEVPLHLEWIRNRDGLMTCSGLQLVRFSSEARLDAIMQIHRDHGVGINNPHTCIVEDGKQARVNPEVVAMKARFDPQGLLNPGKLRGWEQRAGHGLAAAADVPAAPITAA
jgi:FAD/FMN-containing dehydrogenase